MVNDFLNTIESKEERDIASVLILQMIEKQGLDAFYLEKLDAILKEVSALIKTGQHGAEDTAQTPADLL